MTENTVNLYWAETFVRGIAMTEGPDYRTIDEIREQMADEVDNCMNQMEFDTPSEWIKAYRHLTCAMYDELAKLTRDTWAW